MPRYRPVYDLTLHQWKLRDDSDTQSVAEQVAAGLMHPLMAGLDNGGTPPLPGVVLAAQIAVEIAAGWPENRIVWTSLGSESGTGSGNPGALTLTGLSTLSMGTLAGVVISAGSASLGNLSLTGASTLSIGTLTGVQIGNTGNLSLTGTSTLALGSLAGVTGAVNGDLGSLSLTGSSTLALGTLVSSVVFTDDFTGTNNDLLNSTNWPTEYKFGTGINTTTSKATVQTNDASFFLSHTTGTANIGINEIANAVIDLTGSNKYRITFNVKPSADALNGISLVPLTGAGAWNTAGDATNAPNAIAIYTGSTVGNGDLNVRKRSAGTTNYTNQYFSAWTGTGYGTVVVEVSATTLKVTANAVSLQDATESIPLDSTTQLVLWSLSNGASSTSTGQFADIKIEKIQ